MRAVNNVCLSNILESRLIEIVKSGCVQLLMKVYRLMTVRQAAAAAAAAARSQ